MPRSLFNLLCVFYLSLEADSLLLKRVKVSGREENTAAFAYMSGRVAAFRK